MRSGSGCAEATEDSADEEATLHWGGILSDDQLDALVAYIKTLKTD